MNKKVKRIALGLVMALSVAFISGCGNSEKIGYVNLQQVQTESAKYKEVQERVKAKQQEIVKRLSDSEKKDTKIEFDKKLKKSQEEMQIFQLAMQREFKSSIDVAVADVAREKELTIVVDKSASLSGGEDITKAVIDKMGRVSEKKKEITKKEEKQNKKADKK